MSHLDTAYWLGVEAAKCALDISAGTGAPMPSQMPTSGTGGPSAPAPQPMPAGRPSDSATKLSQDFFGSFLERDYDNPTDAPRKTAAEYAVEKALEKLGEPRGRKGTRRGPTSHAPASKGTRFKALKTKLSRKKNVTRR